MTIATRRIARSAVALLAVLAVCGLASQAVAEKKSKSVQTEGQWVGFDPDSNTATVKVRKAGGKVKNKEAAIKQGKEATFDVKPEGSVLTRTTVKINGRKGEITDIPEGKTVNIYWIVDETKATKRFARSIDLILSEEELNERYKVED
jgi:hypothetical protein